MAEPFQTTALELEFNDFWQDFISPKDPWKDSDSLRETDYSILKRKFDKYQKNDALIRRVNGLKQPLLESIVRDRYGCWEGLQVLLESGKLDINVSGSHGRTALSHAAECRDAATMKLLLEHNANPNTKDEDGRTPLMWIIESMRSLSNDFDLSTKRKEIKMITQCLLYAKGMDVNCQDKKGQTALMLAAKKMRYDIIKILIDEKADASKADADGHTWFWWLLMSRERSRPREQDINLFDPIFKVAKEVDLLAMDTGGRTMLSWAVEFQDMAMVKALLDRGADANKYDEGPSDLVLGFPFMRALESDNIDLALLFNDTIYDDRSIRDVKKDNHSLHILAQNIHFVDEERALKLLRKMYEVNYDTNQRDHGGKTPLHYATKGGKERFALGILQRLQGKDLDVKDNEGKTPLFYALENKMTNVVQQLVQKGASIDLSLEWFPLGAGYIRFTLDDFNTTFEFMNCPPDQLDWLPSAGKRIICFYRREDRNSPWLSMPSTTGRYAYHSYMKMGSSLAGWAISHIAVFFPKKGKRLAFELGDFWGIGCGTYNGSQFGFATTIRSATVPQSWKHLCEQFLDQLLQSWESLCVDESEEIEDIREKQLEKQGKSGLIIQQLAHKTLKRAELRRCHQQHVSGLVEAFKNDAGLDSCDESDLIARVNQLKESVGARLDQLEQASKELLQIEFAWVSIREASSIKRISVVTFIFLPLMFASSLFGMNVDVLANNPDWRWYVVIGASSLILTVAIWIAVRFFPIEHWMDESRHWARTFWGNTLWVIKSRMDIKTRWSRHQQRKLDAKTFSTELKV